MKTKSINLITALLTFLIGIGAFLFWNVLMTNDFQSKIKGESIPEQTAIQTSVCHIEEAPNNFDGKSVIFDATAYVVYDGTIILYPVNCNSVYIGNLNFSKLELKSYTGMHSNLTTFLEGGRLNSGENFKEVDIKVTGTMKITYDGEGDKWYSVTPTNIEIISSFREFEPKGAA